MNSTCELGRHAARALKPYPDYKDSGVEWLGNVPAHWQVRRLKNVAGLVMGQSPSSEDCSTARIGLPFIQGCAEFGSDHPEPVQFCLAPAKVSPAGAILLSVRAPVGRLNVADQRYGIGRGLCAVVPRPSFLDATFCRYSLGSSTVGLTLQSTGSTYDAVSVGDVACLRTVVPSIPEQAAIVRFLDHADRRIRRYLRAKQKLVTLLEEQKQAIIHQAVTGQIDVRTGKPYQAYKPSGVEWLGDVPAHWQVRRLRYLIKGRLTYGANAAAEHTDPAWPRYLRITDFSKNGTLRKDTFRSLPPQTAKDYLVEPGDVLLARSGATVGKAFLVEEAAGVACHAGYLIRVRLNRSILHPAFFFAFTQSAAFAMWKDATFIIATIQNIGADRYADLSVPVPPISEQELLLRFLDESTADIDRAVERAEVEMALLREYRTRLIADVVTGKLDVREAAASLLEEAEELEPLDEADALIDGEEEPTDALATAP